ncbi:MAG: zinc-ribbon domain-containing protein [Syntrophobacteria bacterium]|nr:zinc-ribbon domain-containing protein [Deltaproteobacteria bacterium]MDH3851965.1 zinc-ribbon domain-containing protein [Deltaproteobacteria bacterium]MDH3898561.1 zinc-ribbon domain-containing protein [Deltaproteobacteria bacterium]MDH3928685.1 zinc-ribbon domain-containing protein [Deltaproteobacteria bacterium]PNV85922.1 MAG: hypothetical protein C0610_09380 [Desulfobacteraceae bacterium]
MILRIRPNLACPPCSSRRVWWECDKGHEWEAYIHSRSKGYGRCPHCSGRRKA